jgi:glycosyltransferase involved in cell wall biosynthesis
VLNGFLLIFEIRDLWPESAIDTGVLTNKWIINLSLAFESFVYKKAKRINVLTPAFYNTLLDHKGVPADKLIMIPNAADFALSDDLLQNFNSKTFRKENHLEDYFVITYVGAHGVANHLDQVLDAAEVLADTNVLFLLIGQGMEKARLINDAQRRGLNNVRFLDSVPKQEVFKYILASDMGASILKRVDTFKTVYSNKTFDYFSCKKPVLMAIDGISRQLVEDANAGVYVEPENASAYNVIIREYLKDPQRLIHEGENGYQFAKSNFDRQILAEKYINQLIEAL